MPACSECEGRGEVCAGTLPIWETCYVCHGSGRVDFVEAGTLVDRSAFRAQARMIARMVEGECDQHVLWMELGLLVGIAHKWLR